jgi:hypothetical protein
MAMAGRAGQGLTAEEIGAFRRDGFVLPRCRLAPSLLAGLLRAVDGIAVPDAINPHEGGGRAAAAILGCALDEALLGMVELVLGSGVRLWRSEVLQRAPSSAVPWHQDGGPSESLSMRVALDHVSRAAGGMRLLPRGHERLVREVRNARDRFQLALAPEAVDPAITVAGPREPGAIVLYDGRTLYCEPPNQSGRRCAAIVFRYRPRDAAG